MSLKPTPFQWVSFAMIVGVMSTALISPLYGLYKEAWHLLPSEVSWLYVIYMAGALCSLLFLGQLTERFGFKPMMVSSLVLVLIGTFTSMIAWNLRSLLLGRFIVGVASSTMTISATIGLSTLAPPGQLKRATMLSGFLLAFGFGLGPLVGGLMGQLAPHPLFTTYLPTVLLGTVAIWGLLRLKVAARHGSAPPRPFHWRDLLPKLTRPARADTLAFGLTTSLPFFAFGVFGLYASMAPLFLDKLVPWHGPIVSGVAIAVILIVSAFIQIAAAKLHIHHCGSTGLILLVLSNGLLMINLWVGSPVLFGLGVLLTSAGHGMSMLAGMGMINRLSSPTNRSGLLSTYWVVGYLGSMVPMMGMGWIADHWGITTSVCCFCSMVMVMATICGMGFFAHPRIRPVAAERLTRA